MQVDTRLAELHRRRPQALAQLIEEEITSSGLEPGTKLGTKRELQERYGVASTTVNEAIRVLENRGLVQAKPGPGGGLFVARRSGWLALSGLVLDFRNEVTSVQQVLEVRNAVEELIAIDAAEHHRKKDIADLRRLLKAMARLVDNPPAYLRANWDFHRRAAQLCANDFARRLYEGLLDFAESELDSVAQREDFDLRANLTMHEELLEAIASRDIKRVKRAVERHNAQSRVSRRSVSA
jgi:DNA-binding FadR family transcriptional regulator